MNVAIVLVVLAFDWGLGLVLDWGLPDAGRKPAPARACLCSDDCCCGCVQGGRCDCVATRVGAVARPAVSPAVPTYPASSFTPYYAPVRPAYAPAPFMPQAAPSGIRCGPGG